MDGISLPTQFSAIGYAITVSPVVNKGQIGSIFTALHQMAETQRSRAHWHSVHHSNCAYSHAKTSIFRLSFYPTGQLGTMASLLIASCI
jgi:hypothetical protein